MTTPEQCYSLQWFVNQLFVFRRVVLYAILPVKTFKGGFALLGLGHFAACSSAEKKRYYVTKECKLKERTVSRADEG